MNNKIIKIKLFIKNESNVKKIAKCIQNELINNGFKIVNEKYDLAISIGGDGTFLKMIHENEFNDNIYYYGINAGSLGFLTDITKTELNNFIKVIKDKKYHKRKLSLLETSVYHDNGKTNIYSLNEIVIKKDNCSLLKTNVFIDKELLEEYTGDGLLISTTTGSTAYNIAFNGSIIDNDLNVFTLVPIAPINNSIYKSLTSSLVLAKNKKININLNDKHNMQIVSDGKLININNVKKVTTKLSNKSINLISITNNNYFTKINSKIIGK